MKTVHQPPQKIEMDLSNPTDKDGIVHSANKAKKNICVFLVSRPYLGFWPDPKHFIVLKKI